ncbi:four helix bundle protein [Candidatus Bipolaricaulota bacterium]|nr:four helix bundle protein [Candidatus Bipolaricaulota bacterium]
MGRIERFEEIEAWQEARLLVCTIYNLTRAPPVEADPNLRDQLRRAAVSIMANIAEGFERRSDKELTQFLFNAGGSSAEVRSLLYLAMDQKYISADEFERAAALAEEVSKALFGPIRYLQGR